jgi:hypothetical protein
MERKSKQATALVMGGEEVVVVGGGLEGAGGCCVVRYEETRRKKEKKGGWVGEVGEEQRHKSNTQPHRIRRGNNGENRVLWARAHRLTTSLRGMLCAPNLRPSPSPPSPFASMLMPSTHNRRWQRHSLALLAISTLLLLANYQVAGTTPPLTNRTATHADFALQFAPTDSNHVLQQQQQQQQQQEQDTEEQLFPLGARGWSGTALTIPIAMLAAAAGLGGGPLFLPLLIIVLGYDVAHAVPISKVSPSRPPCPPALPHPLLFRP